MLTAYLVCAILGVTWVVGSAMMGHFAGDHGGGHADAHGHAGGHGDTHGHGHGEAHGHGDDRGSVLRGFDLPLFSPTALASLLLGFGGTGMLLAGGLGMPWVLHAPVAVVGGLATWIGFAYATVRLARALDTGTVTRSASMLGLEASVTTSIPADGFGEIDFEVDGTRDRRPARGEGGRAFPSGARVAIAAIRDGTFYVGDPVDVLLEKHGA